MADKRQLEFFLLRYVPDAVKGEFVNFGVMALDHGPNGAELIDVRFMRDWGRVLCLDPQADVDVLLALEKEIRREIGRAKDQVTLLKKMEDSFSNVIQISQVMPSLTEMTAARNRGSGEDVFGDTKIAANARASRAAENSGKDAGRVREGGSAGAFDYLFRQSPTRNQGILSSLISDTGRAARSSCFMRCR